MLIPARTWAPEHLHILALRLLLLLAVVQIMVMFLLWQQRLNLTLLPNITTRPSNTASDCAGTFSIRATVVDHHATVDQQLLRTLWPKAWRLACWCTPWSAQLLVDFLGLSDPATITHNSYGFIPKKCSRSSALFCTTWRVLYCFSYFLGVLCPWRVHQPEISTCRKQYKFKYDYYCYTNCDYHTTEQIFCKM